MIAHFPELDMATVDECTQMIKKIQDGSLLSSLVISKSDGSIGSEGGGDVMERMR